MDEQGTDRKGGGTLSFSFGVVVFLLGNLLLCECPWMFAISAGVFGVAAATATKPFFRWAAVVLVFISAAFAIEHATVKERVRSQYYEHQEKANARQQDSPVQP